MDLLGLAGLIGTQRELKGRIVLDRDRNRYLPVLRILSCVDHEGNGNGSICLSARFLGILLPPELCRDHSVRAAGELTGLRKSIRLSICLEPLLLDIDKDFFIEDFRLCVNIFFDLTDRIRIKRLMVFLITGKDTAYDFLIIAQSLSIISIFQQILMIEAIARRHIIPTFFDVEVSAHRQVGDDHCILGRDTVDGTASTGSGADHRCCPLVHRSVVLPGHSEVMGLAVNNLGDIVGSVGVGN